jgi:hypothetical protein
MGRTNMSLRAVSFFLLTADIAPAVSDTELEKCPHTAIDRFLPTAEPFPWRENINKV